MEDIDATLRVHLVYADPSQVREFDTSFDVSPVALDAFKSLVDGTMTLGEFTRVMLPFMP